MSLEIESRVSSNWNASHRLPRLPWSLLLVLYVPFGLFLTFLRVCMSLQVMLMLVIFPAGAVKR